MDEKRQDDQLEPTYNNSVPIQDVALKTCRKRWTIEEGGGRESGISVLMAQHDDDDDDCSIFFSVNFKEFILSVNSRGEIDIFKAYTYFAKEY